MDKTTVTITILLLLGGVFLALAVIICGWLHTKRQRQKHSLKKQALQIVQKEMTLLPESLSEDNPFINNPHTLKIVEKFLDVFTGSLPSKASKKRSTTLKNREYLLSNQDVINVKTTEVTLNDRKELMSCKKENLKPLSNQKEVIQYGQAIALHIEHTMQLFANQLLPGSVIQVDHGFVYDSFAYNESLYEIRIQIKIPNQSYVSPPPVQEWY